MTSPDDPREQLARLVVRLRSAHEAHRAVVAGELLPLLADPRIPSLVRLAAAARALEALPDSPAGVRDVVRAITAGVPAPRALARLRAIQHLLPSSDALDELVAERETRVLLRCPRCAARLPRPEMAKHLWHEHAMTLAGSAARTRARAVAEVRQEHAAKHAPGLIDRVAAVGGEAALRVWAAETATEDEALALCLEARKHGAGVCPACLALVPPAVMELPPPLALAHGRLAGDGRTFDAGTRAPARAYATAFSTVVLLLAAFSPYPLAAVLVAVGMYVAARVVFRTRGTPDDRALDRAWRDARKLLDRRNTSRFLTRLCLTSVQRGDPFVRAVALNAVIACAKDDPAELALLSAALTLQVDDAGGDAVAGVAELVARAFRGEQSPAFAEYVLATYFRAERTAGERERLRILLLGAAFAAGLKPRDVTELCAAAPHLRGAMQLPPHHLAQLYGVWLERPERAADCPAETRTVFALARESPPVAALLLAREPGLLLVCGSRAGDLGKLGPVLVCASGVSVGGVTVADPAAEVSVEAGGRGLVFGRHTLRPGHAIPGALADELKAWLRFRAGVLAGYPAVYLRGEPGAPHPVLKAFVVNCADCGTACVPVVGAISRRGGT